ncbi:hypothetical protein [Methylobacterium sp. Leaf118]|uniref:hypothetical protein n=1 Tax=Methylobacterium sp. Leaf118 TaxID=2876562 RepID=UPI001E5C623E|nr:hypothetical protein [Methylobacterium sp. Leaf118]
MQYSYVLRFGFSGDGAINDVLSLMMDQARISTRQRSGMWTLSVSDHYSCIKFRRKTDRDDFMEVFETKKEEFFAAYGLDLVSPNTSPSPDKCAESSLMCASVRRKR